MNINGVPHTDRGVQRKAVKEQWPSRKRQARGGGVEYKLPEQYYMGGNRLTAMQSPTTPHVDKMKSANAVIYTDIDRGVQRAEIVNAFDRFLIASKMPLKLALTAFLSDEWQGKKISISSLLRYRKMVHSHDFSGLCGRYGNRRGTGRIDGDDALKDDIIAYFIGTRCSAEIIRNLLIGKGHKDLPSPRRLLQWFENWSVLNPSKALQVRNPDKAKSKYKVAFGDLYGHLTRPNQLWEIDATKTDVICIDGRKNIYAIIDGYTRRMKVLITDTAKTEGSLRLIRAAIEDWGMPETIRTDNGSDFTSRWFKNAMFRCGINHDVTAPYSPEQKGMVERVIGTLNHQFMPLMPGYIGHNVKERKDIQSRIAFAERLGLTEKEIAHSGITPMNHEDLQSQAMEWVEQYYHHNIHSTIKCSPMARLASYEGKIKRLADETDALNYLFAPVASGNGTRRVGNKGVRVDGFNYQNEEMALMQGKDVQVCMDSGDMGYIYISKIESGEFLFQAQCHEITGTNPMEVAMKAREYQRQEQAEINKLRKKSSVVSKANKWRALQDVRFGESKSNNLVALPRAEQVVKPAVNLPSETAENSVIKILPQDRYQKAKMIENRMKSKLDVEKDDAAWLMNYQQSAEYQSFEMMGDDFGDAFIGGK